jgi:hypothetical protein
LRDEDRGVSLDADLKACDVVRKQAGLSWSWAADRRLDQLVDIANEAGAGTRRNELAAALIAFAEPDADALVQKILRWRRVRVCEVVLDTPPESSVVYLARHAPGRRKQA